MICIASSRKYQDGYILRVDRITGSKKSSPTDNKTAVLLLHGILDASPTWLVEGPEKALGTYHQINHSLFLKLFSTCWTK